MYVCGGIRYEDCVCVSGGIRYEDCVCVEVSGMRTVYV